MIASSLLVAAAAWFYPQMDLEIYRLNKMWQESAEVGMRAAHPGEVAKLRDAVEFRRLKDDGTYEERQISPRFRHPAMLRSEAANWEARVFTGEWRPCAKYPDSEIPPHLIEIPQNRDFHGLKYEPKSAYFDAGSEVLAYLECESEEMPVFRLGESMAEANEKDPELKEYVPKMIPVADGYWRTPVPYAFRYLRLDKPKVGFFRRNIRAIPVGRKYESIGSFSAANARWTRMSEVGRRTLYLCSQDFLIDGIKRDRLPWAGDLAVSLMADAYVFGDADIVRRSLSVMDAYLGDVNGIVTYSMWTVIAHDMYQLYFGDRDFLNERWWRVKWRIDNLVARCDGRGFVTKDLGWVFVDWTDDVDPSAMQMIWVGALDAAARLADRVGDTDAAKYRELAAKVRTELNAKHWDDKKGMYGVGRHASVYAVVFDVADAAKLPRIGENLSRNEIPPVGTPYVFGWELVALRRAGYAKAFLDGLERVFGAMLDNRATTFWEGYDAKEKDSERYRFYGRPYAKSLCHVWSAWPAFLFVSEVMGVKPTSDGWQTFEVHPIPGVSGLHATVPTPRGMLGF